VSLVDESGACLQPRLYPWSENRDFPRGEYLRSFLLEKLWVPMQTCLFRREAMARLVGLGKRWKPVPRLATLAAGDILNAILLNTVGGMLLLKEPLLRYRQHGDQEGRGVDQSQHMIELFKILRRMGRRDSSVRSCNELIEARLARYEVQDMVLRTRELGDLARLKRQADSLLARLEERLPFPERPDLLLPLEILARLLDLRREFRIPEADQPQDRATGAFSAWRHGLVSRGEGLFPVPSRIAVLGSLFAAGLLALDARRAGVEVACFLDSSPSRQGQRLLGNDVHPVHWLRENAGLLDAVVISSEGDSEEGVRAMLRGHLGSAHLPLLSWKDLPEAWAGRQPAPGGR
jgi:hypothetical protein